MIYEVTSHHLPSQQARFRVSDEGEVRSVFYDGIIMVTVMTDLVGHEVSGLLRKPVPWDRILSAIARSEFDFVVISRPEVKVMPTNEKLALWCRLYEQFKGIKYKVSPADSGKMKTLSITEELLKFYLDDKSMPENATTWLFRGKQSIANLVKYQNEVRAAMAKPTDSRFPDHYSAEFERKLDGPGITEYRKHLMSLGLVPKRVRGPFSEIIDFIRPDHASSNA